MTTTTTTVLPSPVTSASRFAIPAALLAVYLIWGSTYLVLRWVVESLPAMLAAGARYLFAGIALLAIARARGAAWPHRSDWLRAAAPGALLFVVGNGFVSLAEREVASSQAAIVCGAMPLVTVVFGVFAGERPKRIEIVGLLVGFAGVIAMTAFELGHATSATALLLCAPVGWALGSILTRKLALPQGLAGAALPMVWGGVLALVVGAVMGERWPTAPVPGKAIGAFVYLVVAGSMIAFTAYAYLLRHTRQSVATSYAYVNPVVATLLGVVLGGETLKLHTLLGGALVVLGVGAVIVSRGRRAGSGAR
ncbi:drug/metabolite exporter YedA [soil metagenome]